MLWILVALVGISAINSRKTQRIFRYKIALFSVGLLRILFYFSVIGLRKRIASNSQFVCNSVYREDIYVFSAILEGIAIAVLLFLVHIIKDYIYGKIYLFIL